MGHSFEPTRPHEDRGRARGDLGFGQRWVKRVIASTFTAWAAIGLLSGHMHLLVAGNRFLQILYFQGAAALLLSLGVLLIAGMQWTALSLDAGGGNNRPWHPRARFVALAVSVLCISGAVFARASGWGDECSFALVAPEQWVMTGRLAPVVRWALPWVQANAMAVLYVTAGAIAWTIVVLLLNAVRPVHPPDRRGRRERAILLAIGGVPACGGICLAAVGYLSAAADRVPASASGVSLAYSVLVGCAGLALLLVLTVALTWDPKHR